MQGGHSEKRAAPPTGTAVLGQLKALGSPLTCLQVPREEMLEDKSNLPRYPELSLPAQGWQWVHSLSTQSSRWARAGLWKAVLLQVQQAQGSCDFGEQCFHGGELGRGGEGTGECQAVEKREAVKIL